MTKMNEYRTPDGLRAALRDDVEILQIEIRKMKDGEKEVVVVCRLNPSLSSCVEALPLEGESIDELFDRMIAASDRPRSLRRQSSWGEFLAKWRAMMKVLLLTVAMTAALNAATIVNPSPGSEPNMVDVLQARYGAGLERIDDALDQVWSFGPGYSGRATVVSKHSAASQRLGLCVVCDGTDDALFDQTITVNATTDTPLTMDGVDLFALPEAFSFVDLPFGSPVVGRVTSIDDRNPLDVDHFVSFRVTGAENLFVVAVEDWLATSTPPSDRDFNDLIFEFEAVPPQTVPEPSGALLLGSGLLALHWLRRRYKEKTR